jgi:hypothetical protein
MSDEAWLTGGKTSASRDLIVAIVGDHPEAVGVGVTGFHMADNETFGPAGTMPIEGKILKNNLPVRI